MLIAIAVLLILTMLFNVKFHAGVNSIILDDNNFLYYSFNSVNHKKTLIMDFSDLSSKVQSFALLKEDQVCKEKEISEVTDINNCELEVTDLEAGKYNMRITTDDSTEMIEEIEITS